MPDTAISDALLPVAFSMWSNPGGYAVLAGAGVSLGAGLPSAWGVMTNLADQVRAVTEPTALPLTGDTVQRWWSATYGEDITYSGIFERIAPTKIDREGLLRSQVEIGVEPGQAHRAIARLVQLGVIKVIVTLNFDHLFEDALREIGIEPRIISTEATAATARPVPGGDAVVVHLHGDYRDAASMLNTTDELSDYTPSIRELAARIISDHGLLIAGWSAEHDNALRELLATHHRGYYRPVWIAPSRPTQTARELITTLAAVHHPSTADDAFGRLADAVAALARRGAASRNPMTTALIVDRIKRDLTGDRPAITAHDTFMEEAARLEDLPALHPTDFNTASVPYPQLLDGIADACRPLTAATAALAYWGDLSSDHWWQDSIAQWSRSFDGSGTVALLDLPLTAAVRMFYAAGLALTAARRFELLAQICRIEGVGAGLHEPRPIVRLLDWVRIHRSLDDADAFRLRAEMSETVREALTLTGERMETVWQQFETFRAAAQIMLGGSYDTSVGLRLANLTSAANMDPALMTDRDELRTQLGSLVVSCDPHLRVELQHSGGREEWISPIARRTNADPDVRHAVATLAKGSEQSTERLTAAAQALNAVEWHFNLAGKTAEDQLIREAQGIVTIPRAFWLDGGA